MINNSFVKNMYTREKYECKRYKEQNTSAEHRQIKTITIKTQSCSYVFFSTILQAQKLPRKLLLLTIFDIQLIYVIYAFLQK